MRFIVLAVLFGLLPAAQAVRPTLTLNSRALQPGELVLVTVRTPLVPSVVTAQFEGRRFAAARIDTHEWQVLVGIDLDVAPGAHTIHIDLGQGPEAQRLERTVQVAPHRFATRRLTVAEGFVTPPVDVQGRIAAEAQELERLWTSSASDRLWSGPFVRPVPQSANSAFGTRSIFNGQPRSPHGGADFLSPSGTPVHAPGGGRVLLARELYYTGNTVVIDHGVGVVSLFAHLSQVDVRAGDEVTGGQIIGLVGATGRVTGPHLHWTLRVGTARVDPLSLIAVLGTRPVAVTPDLPLPRAATDR
ncbi:MAG: M23 family metallopeptidase [Vicinamibacterales bacterium]